MVGFLGAIGPILSGVAGIASAFGGGGGGTTQQSLNLGQLRRSAERHGFNPLTVLRNAPSGFMTTHHPSLSSAETIARAISAGIDGFMATGVQQATAQKERELLDAQLGLIEAQTQRVRSAPRLNISAVNGTARGASSAAGSLSGGVTTLTKKGGPLYNREPLPIEGPQGIAGYSRKPTKEELQISQPDTYIQINPETGVQVPSGHAGAQTLEDYSEFVKGVEDIGRLGDTMKQDPAFLPNATRRFIDGVGASMDHVADEWDKEFEQRRNLRRNHPPVPRSEGWRQYQFDQGVFDPYVDPDIRLPLY